MRRSSPAPDFDKLGAPASYKVGQLLWPGPGSFFWALLPAMRTKVCWLNMTLLSKEDNCWCSSPPLTALNASSFLSLRAQRTFPTLISEILHANWILCMHKVGWNKALSSTMTESGFSLTSLWLSPTSLNFLGVLLRAYLHPLKYILQEQPKEKEAPQVLGSLPWHAQVRLEVSTKEQISFIGHISLKWVIGGPMAKTTPI